MAERLRHRTRLFGDCWRGRYYSARGALLSRLRWQDGVCMMQNESGGIQSIDELNDIREYEPEALEQRAANEIITLREALKNLLDVFERSEAGFPPEVELIFLAKDLAKEMVFMNDWISVKDKLPKNYEVVFIFPRPDDWGVRYAGLIDITNGWQYYSDGGNEWNDCNVTHWMPIPDDPSVEDYNGAQNLFSPDDVVQHRKGGTYKIVGRCTIEATMTDCYAYSGEDGNLWIRPTDEMEDGRFSLIEDKTHNAVLSGKPPTTEL